MLKTLLPAAVAGALALFAAGAPAAAFGSRPERACAPYAHDLSLPGLWLGHFTGGRLERDPASVRVLDWRDQYACFPTQAACDRWQDRLRRRYDSVDGYKTCLPLRAGGVRIVRRVSTHVVIAKY